MAEILGTASGVAGLASVSLQLFDSCVKGFILLRAVQGYGSRADTYCCLLDWEHYRLHRWATIVGLFRQPPELNAPNTPLVKRTLQILEQVLTDVHSLQDQYGLRIAVTEEDVDLTDSGSRGLFADGSLNKSTKEFINTTARVYHKRAKPWKKLKWAAFDQDRFSQLISDIHTFNEALHSALDSVDQQLYNGTSSTTLRSVVAHTTDKSLLDVVSSRLQSRDGAIQAAAKLKQKGLLLEVVGETQIIGGSETPTSTRSTYLTSPNSVSFQHRRISPARALGQRAPRIEFDDLQRKPEAQAQQPHYEVAIYDQKSVIVEWKMVSEGEDKTLKHRVAAVADFLAAMSDPSFHSLTCVGYVRFPKRPIYGYLFEPPLNGPFSVRSLINLLEPADVQPSLNDRVSLAAALVETVLQLHTGGCLHKSIRPDNIHFFRQGNLSWTDCDSLPDMYLGGYEFARADNVLEMTEAPTEHQPSRIYRHPLSLSEDRVPFCKAFDLYSLGCVLLEIALWKPLLTMLVDWTRTTQSSTKSPKPIASEQILSPGSKSEWQALFSQKETFVSTAENGALSKQLRFAIGDKYAQVVWKCLSAATTEDADTAEDQSLSIELESLQSLKAIIENA